MWKNLSSCELEWAAMIHKEFQGADMVLPEHPLLKDQEVIAEFTLHDGSMRFFKTRNGYWWEQFHDEVYLVSFSDTVFCEMIINLQEQFDVMKREFEKAKATLAEIEAKQHPS